MRARGSITGPLILILIGVFFLIHALSPNFQIGELLAAYWPYILIAWAFCSYWKFVSGLP